VSRPPFSSRAGFDLAPSDFAARVAARRAQGGALLDLADANPTRCGLAPAAALAEALAALARDAGASRYEPEPRGDPAARAAIAAYHARRGAAVSPEHVVLCAGTSEGYAHVFRLIGDPGDVVHVPAPGYPLFEQLAALEGLAAATYPLVPPRGGGARWRVDLDAFAASLGPRSRAVVAIDPHNPTGSYVDPADWASLRAIARERGLAIVADEVFADFALPGVAPPPGALAGAGAGPLHLVLSGASKPLALPQLKVAWVVVAGPAPLRDEALARLEFVADAYLSVSPLLARALPGLLAQRDAIARPLRERVARNRAALESALAGTRAQLLPAEAGWCAIVAVPGADEPALVARLVDRGVLVQPGALFDLDSRGAAHLVVSLLPAPATFDRGAAALADSGSDPESR
jgi:aspartate/methionine/tyrosine aminotransferase